MSVDIATILDAITAYQTDLRAHLELAREALAPLADVTADLPFTPAVPLSAADCAGACVSFDARVRTHLISRAEKVFAPAGCRLHIDLGGAFTAVSDQPLDARGLWAHLEATYGHGRAAEALLAREARTLLKNWSTDRLPAKTLKSGAMRLTMLAYLDESCRKYSEENTYRYWCREHTIAPCLDALQAFAGWAARRSDTRLEAALAAIIEVARPFADNRAVHVLATKLPCGDTGAAWIPYKEKITLCLPPDIAQHLSEFLGIYAHMPEEELAPIAA